MLTEREFDEFRVYQEMRQEQLLADIQRFYLGSRAEVVDAVKQGRVPEVAPRPAPPKDGE